MMFKVYLNKKIVVGIVDGTAKMSDVVMAKRLNQSGDKIHIHPVGSRSYYIVDPLDIKRVVKIKG